MTALLPVIGSLLACIIGLWKYFGRKASERRDRIVAAQTTFNEGIQERDPSKITAGFTDLTNA
jgi:hypothetical protein